MKRFVNAMMLFFGVLLAVFLVVPEAHAILGIRAARTVLTARKAKQALAEDPNAEATERANENLKRLEQNGAVRQENR